MAQKPKTDDDFPMPTAHERFAGGAEDVAPLKSKGTRSMLSPEEQAANAEHDKAMTEVMKTDE
jgi:hypothetical protein